MNEGEVAQAVATALDGWHTVLGRQYGPLSRPQRRAMRALAAHPELRVTDLTASLGHTTAGTTRMIDTLEALGYAKRTRLPDMDQRQVYVSLTPAGVQALEEADRAFVAQVATSIAVLTAAERASLATLLTKIGRS